MGQEVWRSDFPEDEEVQSLSFALQQREDEISRLHRRYLSLLSGMFLFFLFFLFYLVEVVKEVAQT